MQYMLLLREPESEFAKRNDPDHAEAYWATRAHALHATLNTADAQRALQTAIGLTEDEAVRAYLRGVAAAWQIERRSADTHEPTRHQHA